jgi:hypothetical protein
VGPQGQNGRSRNISPLTGIRSPDGPAHSESLYRLNYAVCLYSSTIYLLVTPVGVLLCMLICNVVSREIEHLLCITVHNVSSEFSFGFTGYNVLMWSAWFKYECKNSLSGIGVGRERHKEAEICPPLLFELATETNRRLRSEPKQIIQTSHLNLQWGGLGNVKSR